jgi:DNA-binding CsgD family transcriptional regulator
MATHTEDTIKGLDLDRVLHSLREQAPEVMRKLRQLPPPDLAGLELAALHRATSTDEAKLLMGSFLAIRATARQKTGKEVAQAIIEVVALFERARRSRTCAPRRPVLELVYSASTPDISIKAPDKPNRSGAAAGEILSRRQTECLRLKANGLEAKEIARVLGISHNTVTQHLGDAYRRLGVANGQQAVQAARDLGII